MMKLKFIDLFAGIGGFHLVFHRLGGECVFASEIDESARKTYIHNFEKISPQLFELAAYNNNITEIEPQNIPDFDVLCAGFPCQPFSQAGYKKGFSESKDNRGNMFFHICEIIKAKRPKAFFLENVSHILKHDEGRTFAIIKDMLANQLGYDFYYQVVKASDYGLPQHRARIYMIGFDKKLNLPKTFVFPPKKPLKYTMSDIFGGKCTKDIGFTLRVGGRGSKIGDRRNWEFYNVGGEVKRIGIKEAKMMMGLPDDFHFPVSETQSMKQLGNSVAIDAIYEVAKKLLEHLEEKPQLKPYPLIDAGNQYHINFDIPEAIYANA